MPNFNISLASYSFHGLLGEGKLDIFGYLNLLYYKYHVTNADIWTGFTPTTDLDFMRKVRASMDERGISLENLCIDGPHLWVDTPEGRAENKRKMYEYIKAAEVLGAKTLRIDFGGSDDAPMSDEAFEYIVQAYREYCDMTAQFGAKIGPENHWGWDRNPEYLCRVRDAVDKKNYGHLFHFTNWMPGKEDKMTETAISYAMHTHIPANSIPVAKELIRKLAASGYEGTYSIEHHSGKFEEVRVEWQLGAVRSLIAELKEEGIDTPAKLDYFSQTL